MRIFLALFLISVFVGGALIILEQEDIIPRDISSQSTEIAATGSPWSAPRQAFPQDTATSVERREISEVKLPSIMLPDIAPTSPLGISPPATLFPIPVLPPVSPPSPSPIALPPPPPQTSPAFTPETSGKLNEADIFSLTNVERETRGLPPLLWNAQLSRMALVKAKDMLDRQYFAHESPDGKDVAGLAVDALYDYRLVGENLAVGNFRTSFEVVEGWMGSPGHRENILNSEYTQMGAAAIEGMYEGNLVYMAVQEFGRPMPSCPKPDPYLKDRIALYTGQVDQLQGTLDRARGTIESSTDPSVRNAAIHDYNVVVELYNALVVDLRRFIREYNGQVSSYNVCITE